MPLKYRVASLDDVPEESQALYEKDGDGYRLSVEGAAAADEVRALEDTLRKVRQELKDVRRSSNDKVSEADLEELARLRADAQKREEEKAKQEGRWEDLRAKLQEDHAKQLEKLQATLQTRDTVIKELTVTNQLRSALTEAGVKPEYLRAAELLLKERGPKVEWEDGQLPRGVFPDEVHGDKPIGDFVKEWAASDEASPYMPPETATGGGGSGEGGGKAPPSDKAWSEMTLDEKADYAEQKYGSGAAA